MAESLGRKFKSLNEFTPFWNFEENKLFIGFFREEKTFQGKEENFQVFEFFTEEGEVFNLPDKYQIRKAIATAPPKPAGEGMGILFKFEYLGKTKLANKRSVLNFNCAYCEAIEPS